MANGNHSNLPPGFVIDEPQGLPQGFALDEPEAVKTGRGIGAGDGFQVSDIPGAGVAEELAAAINRGAINVAEFFTTDQLNALADLTGFEGLRTTPLSQTELGRAFTEPQLTEGMQEGLAREAVRAGGELMAPGGVAGAATRAVAKAIPKLAPLAAGTPTTDVAFSGVSGVGGEVGREIGGEGGAVIGAIATPLAAGGAASLVQNLSARAKQGVPKATQELLDAAKKQGVDILTTDAVPPETFAGRTLQQLGEKLGVLGTGAKRAAQQRARIEIVEGLADDMGLTLDAPLEAGLFKSLKTGVAKQLERAAEFRNSATSTLDNYGVMPIKKAVAAIDEQIAKQNRLKGDADPQIIARLNSLRESLGDSNFGVVKDLRSNLIDDISAAFKGEKPKAAAPLQAVKKAIDDDLLSFAKAKDRKAAADWLKSNQLFADGYRKAKNTEIKRLLKKGEGTPETVMTVLRGGKPSELKRMRSVVGEEGARKAQLAIIRDALEESQFFTVGANPNRFATALNKPSRQKAINVFFAGSDKKQIEGISRVLNATRRAQDAPVSTATGQQLIAPVAALAGAQLDAGISFGVAGSLAGMSRAYESATMRNLLIRLSNAKAGSAVERQLLNKAIPFFSGAVESQRSQE